MFRFSSVQAILTGAPVLSSSSPSSTPPAVKVAPVSRDCRAVDSVTPSR